jgi:hypothetical protein
MKKNYLLAGSLAFSLLVAKAQQAEKQRSLVNEFEINAVYNHYLQDGNNSAVTGGKGTERLTIYGPSISTKRTIGKHQVEFTLGSDIISSASTDRIDDTYSSASRLDARTFSNLFYTQSFEKSKISITGGLSGSIESDYFSIGKHLGLSKTSYNEMQTFQIQAQLFNDDLRWGRLDGNGFQPEMLIYPEELRYKEWYDEYKRDSYNLNLGFTQVINTKNTFGAFAQLGYQHGLLATPFHRIIFKDNSRGVEQLPTDRYKTSLAARWNSFIKGRYILKNTLGGYWDSFGVLSIFMENETAVKINSQWTLAANLRWHQQRASRYFKGYKEHESTDRFYTSDYDYSKFATYDLGLAVKHRSLRNNNWDLGEFAFRYTYYHRTTDLNAHIISTTFTFKTKKK